MGDDLLDLVPAERRDGTLTPRLVRREPLAQRGPARGGRSTWRCRPAARSPSGSPRTRVEGVLQHDHRRLRRPGARRASRRARAASREIAPRATGSPSGAGARSSASGSCAARRRALGRVAARVHDEAVQPGRELRLAAELRSRTHELRERLLRGVARVLGVAQQVQREPLDPAARGARTAPRARAGRRPSPASPGSDRRAARRRGAVLPERLPNRTACARSGCTTRLL